MNWRFTSRETSRVYVSRARGRHVDRALIENFLILDSRNNRLVSFARARDSSREIESLYKFYSHSGASLSNTLNCRYLEVATKYFCVESRFYRYAVFMHNYEGSFKKLSVWN